MDTRTPFPTGLLPCPLLDVVVEGAILRCWAQCQRIWMKPIFRFKRWYLSEIPKVGRKKQRVVHNDWNCEFLIRRGGHPMDQTGMRRAATFAQDVLLPLHYATG
jgi:hypothetical protein